MHDLPLSPEDRGTLLQVVRSQPPRDRLLAELVYGHGLGLAETLSVRAEEIAWGEERAKLAAHGPRALRRTVTVEEAAGVPSGVSVKRVRGKRAVGSR